MKSIAEAKQEVSISVKNIEKWSLIKTKADKIEECLEIMEKACNVYKIHKDWQLATTTYLQMTELAEKINQDPSLIFQDAYQCAKKSGEDFIKIGELAIKSCLEHARYPAAIKIRIEIAEYYEAKIEIWKAAEQYLDGVTMHEDFIGKLNHTMLGYLKKVIELRLSCKTDFETITDAIKIISKIDSHRLTKDYELWIQAALLRLLMNVNIHFFYLKSQDSVGANLALENYENEDPGFKKYKNYQGCKKLIDEFESNPKDLFEELDIYSLDNELTKKTLIQISEIHTQNQVKGFEIV